MTDVIRAPDPQRDATETLRVLLELSGHRVVVAHTGSAGVEAARTLSPDVVLCDLGLPGMDGYAVARTLREHPGLANRRLIPVSGYGQAEDRLRSLEANLPLAALAADDLLQLTNPCRKISG